MSESNLILKNISKSYYQANNSLSILKDISLEVKSGDFIAVTGPSGSGSILLTASQKILPENQSKQLANNIGKIENKGSKRLI